MPRRLLIQLERRGPKEHCAGLMTGPSNQGGGGAPGTRTPETPRCPEPAPAAPRNVRPSGRRSRGGWDLSRATTKCESRVLRDWAFKGPDACRNAQAQGKSGGIARRRPTARCTGGVAESVLADGARTRPVFQTPDAARQRRPVAVEESLPDLRRRGPWREPRRVDDRAGGVLAAPDRDRASAERDPDARRIRAHPAARAVASASWSTQPCGVAS
jgi:hypothetical protein